MKKNVSKIANQVMRLSFFANRYGFCAKDADFAILSASNEDGETKLTPVVAVGEDLYIDILSDEIHPYYNVGGCIYRCLTATVVKKQKKYIFSNNFGECEIEAEAVYNLYKSKFLHTDLLLEAKCLKK